MDRADDGGAHDCLRLEKGCRLWGADIEEKGTGVSAYGDGRRQAAIDPATARRHETEPAAIA